MLPEDKSEPARVEQSYSSSPDEVWAALTDVEKMVQWYFPSIEEFRPVLNSRTKFSVSHEGRDYIHLWNVTEVVPQERISYSWDYEGYPGHSEVTFSLEQRNGETVLTLTHRGLETFPQDVETFSKESCTAGWNYFLGQSLKRYLDG